MTDPAPPPSRSGILSSLGPAIITASVVLGPGSILSASKIGHGFGYQMVWVLALAVVLMIGMTALSARLGVLLDGTLCDELARRAGRPFAAVIGIAVFLIVACFQFGNNQGVLAALEPFYESGDDGGGAANSVPILIIVNLNLLVIVALFGFRALYRPVERSMKLLVGLMMIGFAGNLIWARPDLLELLKGLVPSLPQGAGETLLPRWQPAVAENGNVAEPGRVVDYFDPAVAMFATTFSVAGAFYQSYLVRQKGWNKGNLRQGLVDSAVGISILGLARRVAPIACQSGRRSRGRFAGTRWPNGAATREGTV
jgi:manganese transport protein